MGRGFWVVLAAATVLHISGLLRGRVLPVIAGLYMLDRCVGLVVPLTTSANMCPNCSAWKGASGWVCRGVGRLREVGLEEGA